MRLQEKVFRLVRQIPKGKVTTYKELAYACGVKAYRAIGTILSKNEDGFLIKGKTPCHRVISSSGHIGGFCGVVKGKEISLKKTLLEKEGIRFDEKNYVIDFEKKMMKF